MKYFSPLFFLTVSGLGMAISLHDIAVGKGQWFDRWLIVLHLVCILNHVYLIDERANKRNA